MQRFFISPSKKTHRSVNKYQYGWWPGRNDNYWLKYKFWFYYPQLSLWVVLENTIKINLE